MHPIHKHMSSRMGGRKADERYDAKEAYNKDLSGKARLHYLENDIHDKGMSMKTPMDMKSPMDMGHSPAEMKSPMQVGPGVKPGKKKEYSFGQKLMGTAKNVGDYISGSYNKSEVLAGIGVTNPHGSDAERKHDLGKSKKAFARAAKRKKEGSAFFMESEGQEKKDLMKYNPVDDRAGSKKKTSPVNMASPMYDKGHEGDQDGHMHPRTQGEADVMNKHGQALNKFIGKVNKFGPMSESQRSKVNDRIKSLEGQYNKTRDSIGNVHKQFDLKRDQEFEDLFGDKR